MQRKILATGAGCRRKRTDVAIWRKTVEHIFHTQKNQISGERAKPILQTPSTVERGHPSAHQTSNCPPTSIGSGYATAQATQDCNCYVTLSKLHFSSVLLFYYVRLSHILLNTVLLLVTQQTKCTQTTQKPKGKREAACLYWKDRPKLRFFPCVEWKL